MQKNELSFQKNGVESIIRGLKTQNQVSKLFSTNTDDLISDLSKSNKYPVRGSRSLLRFSCEAVFQICRNRQIGLTREIIVQCTDELENKTKIDGWHDEIKSIIGEKNMNDLERMNEILYELSTDDLISRELNLLI